MKLTWKDAVTMLFMIAIVAIYVTLPEWHEPVADLQYSRHDRRSAGSGLRGRMRSQYAWRRARNGTAAMGAGAFGDRVDAGRRRARRSGDRAGHKQHGRAGGPGDGHYRAVADGDDPARIHRRGGSP